MKEKIKFITLIIVFVILLFGINNMLKEAEVPTNTADLENTNIEENIENTVTTSNNTNQILNNQENELVNESVENTTDKETEIETGTVIEVNESSFEKEVLQSEKTVLIDFYADWCNPCKILSPIVEEVAKENPDLKVVKIDVDTNSKLSYQYGAYSIPTLVVIKDGEEVNRSVGVIPKTEILELVK